MTLRFAVATFALTGLACGAVGDQTPDPTMFGGPIGPDVRTEACISPEMRAFVSQRVRDFLAAHPELRRGDALSAVGAGQPRPFTFYPMGGTFYEDVFTNNFVDLDDTAGLLDWNCSARTYNGHKGNDTNLRSFAEQDLGIPVFAARAGVVVDAHDGEFDEQTSIVSGCADMANYVVIEHDNGLCGLYWHLRNGSVAVGIGESVIAGQQIGEVGSSGCSDYPHLHFELSDGVDALEPYAGPCGPSESLWYDQDDIVYDTYAWDFGISTAVPDVNGGLPYELPRNKQLPVNQAGYLWAMINNLPANATGQVIVQRPDDSVFSDTGAYSFGNSVEYRWSWWYWNRTPDVAGTWNVRILVNGVDVVNAPFVVNTNGAPETNTPPNELLGIALDPPDPRARAPLGAVAQTPSRYLDDPDYDLLQYQYQWVVNGMPVRNVTTGATSDYLHTPYPGGSTVTVRVRATDGVANTAWQQTSTTLRPPADDCFEAVVLTEEGPHPFSSNGATTDGPPHPACLAFEDNNVQSDLWYQYESPVTGTLNVSTCSSADFDTRIAIYEGIDCGSLNGSLLGCNDDAPNCADFTSYLTVLVNAGQTYLIRIGGYQGATGTGVFTVTTTDESEYCAADITSGAPGVPDGNVDALDFLVLISQWGTPCVGACQADLTGPTPGVPDGNVDSLDFLLLISQWGSPGNCP